jgi:hypothetical protein
MVQLIPGIPNPTMADIEHAIRVGHRDGSAALIQRTLREIQSKSGAGALLHPAEEYFLERATNV